MENLSNEIWKSIDGYEDYYEVSSLGNVRSFDRVAKVEDKWYRFLKLRSLFAFQDEMDFLNKTFTESIEIKNTQNNKSEENKTQK